MVLNLMSGLLYVVTAQYWVITRLCWWWTVSSYPFYLTLLNPDDVANVTVLKGASASALYGSDASNGVLIVTSRKGRPKPTIRLCSSTVNFGSIAYLPNFQNSFGPYGGEGNRNPISANPYAGVVGIGDNPYIVYVPYENQNYGPRYNGQKIPIGAPIRVFNPDGTYNIKQDSIPYSAVPNAKSSFFNTGIQTQNGLSYAVGDDKSNFYISFQDVLSHGIIPDDKSRRDNFHINGSHTTGIFTANTALTIRLLQQTELRRPDAVQLGNTSELYRIFRRKYRRILFPEQAPVLEHYKPACQYQFPDLQELADRPLCESKRIFQCLLW